MKSRCTCGHAEYKAMGHLDSAIEIADHTMSSVLYLMHNFTHAMNTNSNY